MKKVIKLIFMIIGCIFIFLLGTFIYLNILTSNTKLNTEKLISFSRSIIFYDAQDNVIQEESNGKSIIEIDKIQQYTKNAFIAIEDKRFYKHNGIDYKGLARAFFNNIKSLSFKEGASTISQQLIKNTHLSSEKTLKRKVLEIKLSKELEKKYTKEEILEKYLNTIYFGDNCYGITSASKHYFSKLPEDLTLNESAMLAGIIKAPTNYSPLLNFKKCMQRKDLVLKQMFLQNLITKEEYNKNYNKDIDLSNIGLENNQHNYVSMARFQLNHILNHSPYSSDCLKVYTYCDSIKQQFANQAFNYDNISCNKSIILLNKNSNIIAYCSTCGDVNRQIGSIIKPLISYAPAIENNLVNSATKILDEKTDFNGYSPNNYNGVYYGNISIKDSLAKSSNVCSVKLLNSLGVSKAKKYLNLLNIPTTENDNSLCLALGATENGVKLSQITSAYSIFNNEGNYKKCSLIKKITDKMGNVIYIDKEKSIKVFSDETVSIMNDMLKYTVENGTAKKLSTCNPTLYAKTGTVGNKNGNTDAYTISYNNKYILGVWYGNNNNTLLNNNITGGNQPAFVSREIWNYLYDKSDSSDEIKLSKNVSEIYIDKISYEKDNQIILADEVCPNRYKSKIILKNESIPKTKSTRFSSPRIETPKTSINNNVISIQLCLPEYYYAKIYKHYNSNKYIVYDSKYSDDSLFNDSDILPNQTYTYSVVPYYENNDKIYYGKEIYLNKIKSSSTEFDDDWWKE